MRLLPLLVIFLWAYIEITLFIKVAAVLGVLVTMLLVVFTSVVGFSLVKEKGMRNIVQMQRKLVTGEDPSEEMIKSVSFALAGFLLLLPGFFTDFLGLLLLLPPCQRFFILHFLPYFRVNIFTGQQPSTGEDGGRIIEGEFQRKKEDDKKENDK